MASGASEFGSLRKAVVIVEVALSFVLLVGSGLMARSFLELRRVDPGYDPRGVLTFFVTRDWPLEKQEGRIELLREIQSRLSAVPGVESATAALVLPLGGGARAKGSGGFPAAGAAGWQGVEYQQVMADYFETLRTRLIAGRTFTDHDNSSGNPVAVIDELLAEHAFPDERRWASAFCFRGPAIRRRKWSAWWRTSVFFRSPIRPATFCFLPTAADVGRWGFALLDGPDVWRPGAAGAGDSRRDREDRPATGGVKGTDARSAGGARSVGHPVRTAADRCVRFRCDASSGRGFVQGAGDYRAAQNRGDRRADGARRGPVKYFPDGGRAGLEAERSWRRDRMGRGGGLTRIMNALLVGITATDPSTFAGMAAVFLAIAAVACWIPAARAARVDPMAALRSE